MNDYQDQIIHITCKVAVTSARQLLQIFPAIYHAIVQFQGKEGKIVHGKQSLKRLNLQNRELSSIPISDEDMKAMKREFKSYSVDFSIYRDKADDTTHIFFKAQDVDRVYAALTHIVKNMDQSQSKRLDDLIRQTKMRAEKYNQAHSQNQSYQQQKHRSKMEPAK